jgi:hypothetical protein
MPWSRELNRLNPMDWPKILYDLFGTRFPIASQIAVTLLGAALFGGAWWVLARHARLSPSLNPSQTASAPIGLSPKPSEKEPSETAEISSQDELRILAKSYSNEKTDGIVIYLYNDRQTGIAPSVLKVKDAASFDARKGWFREADTISALIARYPETKSGRVAKAPHWEMTGQSGTWLLRGKSQSNCIASIRRTPTAADQAACSLASRS